MYDSLTKDRKVLDELFRRKIFRRSSKRKNYVRDNIIIEDEYWYDSYLSPYLYDDKTDYYLYTPYKDSSTQTTPQTKDSSTQTAPQTKATQTDTQTRDNKFSYLSFIIKSLLSNRYI